MGADAHLRVAMAAARPCFPIGMYFLIIDYVPDETVEWTGVSLAELELDLRDSRGGSPD